MKWASLMNYYDELGLSKTATTEEIRQAYKSLVRLLHPDHHQDEKLRLMAECQMKRLHEIVGVLIDADKRREYDAGLEDRSGLSPANIPVPIALVAPHPDAGVEALQLWRIVRGSWVWVVMAAVGLGSIVGYFNLDRDTSRDSTARSQSHTALQPSLTPEVNAKRKAVAGLPRNSESLREKYKAQAQQLSELQEKLETVRSERDAALAEIGRLRSEGGASSAVHPVVKERVQEPAPNFQAASPGAPVMFQGPSPPRRSGFGGIWFYAGADRGKPAETLYPPEYIELVILEQASVLRGRYWARYQISDRAISPEVAFQFEGQPPSQNSARFPWSAGGGAKGELQLKLLSENSMEVNWWATCFGKGMGLASGTAVLIRRQEP
ncbi:MAG: J domain-containing protein [Acidobacteria bacterium]|nr:J domain-containing protein [Acidobacteriota bacterium]